MSTGRTTGSSRQRGVLIAVVLALAATLASGCGVTRGDQGDDLAMWIPNSPGGGYDQTGRAAVGVMEREDVIDGSFEVTNIIGGGGSVAMSRLMNAEGDENIMMTVGLGVVGATYSLGLEQRPQHATPLAQLIEDQEGVLVPADSPYKTIEDFVKAAKAKPGGLTVGGTATLTEDHIFTYLFEKAAGIQVKYVPFNSGGEVTTALMGGHIDAAVENPNEIVAQIEAGKARNLAVASRERLKDAPDVPTFAEKGYKFYWEQMRGVVGPANMPPEAVKWWVETLRKVVKTEKWQKDYIKRNLLTPTDWTGEQANKYLDSLHAKYEEALKGIKAASK